jgi:hypothetical protein
MPLSSTPPDNSSENAKLMKSVLPPLLEDFQHWFGRTLEMIETRKVGFLNAQQQQDLTERLRRAQKQVSASQALAAVTEGQATIEMPLVMSWNKLVHECWGVAMRSRQEEQREKKSTEGEPS